MTSSIASRRRFLAQAGVLLPALAWGRRGAAATRDLVVLTAYPDAVVARVEAAFEKAYPEHRLRIVWRMPHDALPYLMAPGQNGVDVYWSASPPTYARLKAAGQFQPLGIDRAGLPGKIGNTVIDDPDGRYVATETAGYGFAVNPDYLIRHGLSAPGDWADLAEPRYAGHLVTPNPAQVGFAPVMVDIPLQAYGWKKGWAVWTGIAVNSTLVGRGATFVSDEVASGRAGIGLTIDFFAAAAIANGAPLKFLYPRQGGINPGQIGILSGCRNRAGAEAFVQFLLSDAGQGMLTHPDIRKLPVRPSVYQTLPPGYHNPFAVAERGGYTYDSDRGRSRLPLLAAGFQQGIARHLPELKAAWTRCLALPQARGARIGALLSAPPFDEAEASDPALLQAFAERGDQPEAEKRAAATEKRWAADADRRLDQALKDLKTLGAA